MANDQHTFHVHFGRNHSLKKTCGLCDQEFKIADPGKCKIYVFDNSGCKEIFANSSVVKELIKGENRKGCPEQNSFSYYIC